MEMYELQDERRSKRRARRRRRLLWSLLILLVVGGAGYYGYITYYQPQTAAPVQETGLTTAQVTRGDLTLSVDGVGNLLSANEIGLGFDTSGVVMDIAVQPGDVVTKGQVLAALDDTTVRYAVVQAGINLRQQQLQLTTLTKAADPADIAAAQATLAAAQENLNQLTEGPDNDALAAAQNDLLSAQQAYNTLVGGMSADEQTSLQADLRSAEVALHQAQSAYNQISWQASAGMSSQATALQNATIAYERALAQYNLAAAGPAPADISAARARIAQARSQLNTLQTSPAALTRTELEARVTEAQSRLDTLLTGPAEEEVETANLALQQAQQNLDSAMRDLAGTVVKAPVSGVITAVNTKVGEQAGAAVVITVAAADATQVRFWLEEADAASVKLGYPANVIFEAFPDDTFSGQVVRIDPTLVTVDGAAAVQVWASIDPAEHPVNLLFGMNASVEVIAGQARNAVLVPVQALRELTPGSFAVFVVLPDGELELRPVEVGLKDFVNVEIRSGVEPGETVSTGNGGG
ncbi:MAG: efflux RND transporter periplasmic adaptor subunit [Caldilineaceae bacterium]